MQVLLSRSLNSIHASGQLAYKLTPLWVVGEEIHIMIGRTYTFHRDTPEGRMERRSLPLWGSRSTSCATVLPWVMRNSNLPSELLNASITLSSIWLFSHEVQSQQVTPGNAIGTQSSWLVRDAKYAAWSFCWVWFNYFSPLSWKNCWIGVLRLQPLIRGYWLFLCKKTIYR